jgi:hypothetical protein
MSNIKNLIKYNNQYLPNPTPLVSFEKELLINTTLDSEKEIIKLKGTITGDFDQIKNTQLNLINIFGSNFKTFEIYESGLSLEKIYEKTNVIVDGISFDREKYNGILGYSIDLYKKSGIENVIDKKNEFYFNLEKDQLLTVRHNISAKGLNTNGALNKSNALNNAISYVNSLTGLNQMPDLTFINLKNNNFYLKDKKEVLDRINAAYSIEETYANDASDYGSNNGILRYNLNIESGNKNNFITLRLNGELQGGEGSSIETLRNSINATGIISSIYQDYYNHIPIEYSIEENPQQKKINFTYTFDSIDLPNPFITYSISKKYDEIYETTEINIKANIKARGNEIAKINASSNLIETLNLYNIATKFSNSYQLYLINTRKTVSLTEGVFELVVIYSDRKPFHDYKTSYSPSFKYVKTQKTYNGGWVFQDFNIKTLDKVNIEMSYPATENVVFPSVANQIIRQSINTTDNGKIKKYQLEGYSQSEYNIEP